MDFILEQHNRAELHYLNTQQKFANYQDANRGISSASARIEGERLQSDYSLANNIYNNLSQQLEQARIKVQETTPVIRVIEPSKELGNKIKPKRGMIIITMLFLGLFFSLSLIGVKNLSKIFTKKE